MFVDFDVRLVASGFDSSGATVDGDLLVARLPELLVNEIPKDIWRYV